MTPGARELLEVAREAAALGGRELAERFEGKRTISYKGGIDLVTDADKAAEAAIVAFLLGRYPDHAVLAEEGGASAGSAPVRWIIDPLDGTTNYAHQVPHFCVSVGAELSGVLVAGAIFDPIRDELFTAALGEGAYRNDVRLRVSEKAELGRALLATGFPYDIWNKPDQPLKLFDGFIKQSQGVRRMGSAALDLAYVAAGRFDGFFELGLKPWDIAAGTVLIREAGGKVSSLAGGPLELDGRQLLASNGKVHDAMVTVVRSLSDAMNP